MVDYLDLLFYVQKISFLRNRHLSHFPDNFCYETPNLKFGNFSKKDKNLEKMF